MKHIYAFFFCIILAAHPLIGQTDTTVYEHRPFQFTFLFPPLSTNGINNGRIVT